MAFMDVLTHSLILRRTAAGNPPAEIEAGLANANQKNSIGEQRQNLYLTQRLQQFITFLRQGNSIEDAARRARIPIHFVNTLKQLGSTSTK